MAAVGVADAEAEVLAAAALAGDAALGVTVAVEIE